MGISGKVVLPEDSEAPQAPAAEAPFTAGYGEDVVHYPPFDYVCAKDQLSPLPLLPTEPVYISNEPPRSHQEAVTQYLQPLQPLVPSDAISHDAGSQYYNQGATQYYVAPDDHLLRPSTPLPPTGPPPPLLSPLLHPPPPPLTTFEALEAYSPSSPTISNASEYPNPPSSAKSPQATSDLDTTLPLDLSEDREYCLDQPYSTGQEKPSSFSARDKAAKKLHFEDQTAPRKIERSTSPDIMEVDPPKSVGVGPSKKTESCVADSSAHPSTSKEASPTEDPELKELREMVTRKKRQLLLAKLESILQPTTNSPKASSAGPKPTDEAPKNKVPCFGLGKETRPPPPNSLVEIPPPENVEERRLALAKILMEQQLEQERKNKAGQGTSAQK